MAHYFEEIVEIPQRSEAIFNAPGNDEFPPFLRNALSILQAYCRVIGC